MWKEIGRLKWLTTTNKVQLFEAIYNFFSINKYIDI